MAAKYVKLTAQAIQSAYSDYSRATQMVDATATATPDEAMVFTIEAETTGTTLDLSMFTTITQCIVVNEDATNYLEVEWYYLRGTRAAANLAFADSGTDDTITSAAADLVSSGGEAGGYVRVGSAEDAANDGTYLIQTISTTVATLASSASLTTNADDDTAILYFERRNKDRVAASKFLVLGPMAAAEDLTLTANTATTAVTVYVWGT